MFIPVYTRNKGVELCTIRVKDSLLRIPKNKTFIGLIDNKGNINLILSHKKENHESKSLG